MHWFLYQAFYQLQTQTALTHALAHHWAAMQTLLPAAIPLGQQPLRIHTERRNANLDVWYLFISNLWELITWKVSP